MQLEASQTPFTFCDCKLSYIFCSINLYSDTHVIALGTTRTESFTQRHKRSSDWKGTHCDRLLTWTISLALFSKIDDDDDHEGDTSDDKEDEDDDEEEEDEEEGEGAKEDKVILCLLTQHLGAACTPSTPMLHITTFFTCHVPRL